MSRIIISVYVDNQSGVLMRICSLFSRRGFNIDTLSVGETEDPNYSRMTITMNGDEYERLQVINQLNKLHNVKKVEILEKDASARRELALIKVGVNNDNRQDIISAVTIFRCNIIDYTPEAVVVEVTGEASKIDAFIEVMRPFGIKEVARTGLAALERGNTCMLEK